MEKKENSTQGRKATGISILILTILVTIGMLVDSSKGGSSPGMFFIVLLIGGIALSIWLINTPKPPDKNNDQS